MNRRDAIKDTLLFAGMLTLSTKPSFAKTQIDQRKSIIRKVAQLGNISLRTKTKLITKTDQTANDFLRNLIADMVTTMNDSEGVGLASAQVFEDLSLFVFINDIEQSNIEIVMNPKILKSSKEIKKGYEGCLSIPGIRALVPRNEWIEVEYINIENKKIKRKYTDFIARIFQHEFDHLNGIVYLDRLESNKDIISEEEYKKLPK